MHNKNTQTEDANHFKTRRYGLYKKDIYDRFYIVVNG